MTFKKQIYFKTVFLVGADQTLVQSEMFLRFLLSVKEAKMRPFKIYLVRDTESQKQIEKSEFSHLLINAKLPLFPNIVVKKSDFIPDKNVKDDFKILLCQSNMVKKA